MIVPLVVIQTGSSLSASAHGKSSSRGGAARHGTAAAAGRAGYFPAWQLAADSIKSTAATGASANLAVPPMPTTTVPTTPSTTAATSAPTTTYVTPTTQAARAQTTAPATNPAPAQVAAPAPAPVAAAPPPANSITGVVTYYDATPGTCASPTLPFGTVVTITNPDNGATVSCTVDDREADTARQIDLATATFAQIAPLSQGVISNAELSW
ncbi:MAG TPA: septal ring lytic transglycosylase RlpA family protein [Acidimicrobiales bacterium]|nr:septal ring lytic transglycosylase RlpA family protein [Acidimicrobiales bacterium]